MTKRDNELISEITLKFVRTVEAVMNLHKPRELDERPGEYFCNECGPGICHTWEIMPKKSAIDYLIEAFKAPFKPQPKRQPITKVRRVWRGPNSVTGRIFSTWCWQCALCDYNQQPRETGSTHYGELCFTWVDAYRRATHHARIHHRKEAST